MLGRGEIPLIPVIGVWWFAKLVGFMSSRNIVLAIDGPAGAGKSTIAKRLAARLGFLYIDTGAMYRAVALWALRTDTSLDDMHRLEQLAIAAGIELYEGGTRVRLDGEDITTLIRTQEISEAASKISAIPGVRRALVDKQRVMGSMQSVVMEGRDIGTNVFPNAQVKIYLDASIEVRARRRKRDLDAAGQAVSLEQLMKEIERRDLRDSSRGDAPLREAEDAVRIDSTGLSLEEVEEAILKVYRQRTSN